MHTLLLTGFVPFLTHAENPSQLIAEALHNRIIAGTRIHSLILPVAFGPDRDAAVAAIEELHPVAVISLGLAANSTEIRVERIALNLRASDDNSTEIPILPTAPAAYFSTLPVDKIATAIHQQNIPAKAHTNAGNYVCNHLMFQLLHHFAPNTPHTPSGFIHVPNTIIPFPQLVQAITTAIDITLTPQKN
jgi:pyroglutamyl-peptidase